jgi:Flp pilus assembly protein TadG
MSSRQRQRGLAATEFALVLPVLLLLMLATVEVGRAFVQFATLSHAVRNSVRHVAERALLGTTGVVALTSVLQTEARNLVVYGNTAGSGAPVVPGLTTGQVNVLNAGGGSVAVQVVYPYQSLVAGALPDFGFAGTLSTAFTFNITTTMRAL